MKFATIGHIMEKSTLDYLPYDWNCKNIICSPEKKINGTSGYITGLTLTPQEILSLPIQKVRKKILDTALFLQNELDVDLIQLGALTTSVTSGGIWLTKQKEFRGYVNHGDSFTAAVTCQIVDKALDFFNKKSSDLTISIIGAYGVIGEAISKILVPEFKKSILIGRRQEKLEELKTKLNGTFKTTTSIETQESDIIVTATSHPTALLQSVHLKKNAIVVDVSQPVNLSQDVCSLRPDISRIDGGFVDFPYECNMNIPGVPPGKLFSCIVEVIAQSLEDEKRHHVGSIDLDHLEKTKRWSEKYGFKVNELTNFGNPI